MKFKDVLDIHSQTDDKHFQNKFKSLISQCEKFIKVHQRITANPAASIGINSADTNFLYNFYIALDSFLTPLYSEIPDMYKRTYEWRTVSGRLRILSATILKTQMPDLADDRKAILPIAKWLLLNSKINSWKELSID